jgi:hypothetical protein
MRADSTVHHCRQSLVDGVVVLVGQEDILAQDSFRPARLHSASGISLF